MPATPRAQAVTSRFGEISPAFAARCGARVDIGLAFAARNAEAKAFSTGERRPRGPARTVDRAELPAEISSAPGIPPSRIRAGLVIDPTR